VITMAQIRRFAEEVGRAFHPERIVLFGSHARGETTSDSDVDVLVVMPYRGKSWQAAVAIRQRISPEFPLDLLVRTPEQVRERLAMGDPFLNEILREGEVLYEAPHG